MTSDGVGLAYSMIGAGPVLVKGATWLSHLEFDFDSDIWWPWIRELSRGHRLLRYDPRGSGLSDWDVDDISFDAFVRDLETVIDAAGVERCALMGISQSCGVCIAYAARHPERVSHLVLYGGYAHGRLKRGNAVNKDEVEAVNTLFRLGWGQKNGAFQRIFSAQMVPEGNEDHIAWWNDLQQRTTTPGNAARIREVADNIDVGDLARTLDVPTLVINRRQDATGCFEAGKRMAALIPGSRFIPYAGKTHIILESDPEWPRFIADVKGFLRS